MSGDRLDLSILLQSDSQALITTPGAGRFYRARSKNSLQKQSVELILDKETSAMDLERCWPEWLECNRRQ